MKPRYFLAERAYLGWLQRRRARFLPGRGEGVPVVSVGNLSLGGTGKTPCVRWLARRALEQGLRPAIVSRGYGGSLASAGALVSDGEQVLLDARQAGDEPIEHARSLPRVPVIIGRDRHAGAHRAREIGADLVILDDGFGFWSLRRECDLMLLDARRPLGNRRLLPRGRLREEPQALSRAHAILLTRAERASKEEIAASKQLIARFSSAPIWVSQHRADGLIDEQSREPMPVQVLAGAPVVALSALADNAQFARSLQQAGARVVAQVARRDHYRWSRADLESARKLAQKVGAGAIVTTGKDAAKIDADWMKAGGVPLWSLRIELEIDNGAHLWDLVRHSLFVGG